jgi:hypothetical protein
LASRGARRTAIRFDPDTCKGGSLKSSRPGYSLVKPGVQLNRRYLSRELRNGCLSRNKSMSFRGPSPFTLNLTLPIFSVSMSNKSPSLFFIDFVLSKQVKQRPRREFAYSSGSRGWPHLRNWPREFRSIRELFQDTFGQVGRDFALVGKIRAELESRGWKPAKH